MFLIILLVIAALLGGFMAASNLLVQNVPSLKKFLELLMGFKKPIGVAILLIGIINIFNFWSGDYPLLTWMAVVLTGMVLTTDLIAGINIPDNIKEPLISFLNSNSVIIGIITLIIGILKIISRLSGFLNRIL